MSYEDRTLSCMECGQPFTFSADDQSYHAFMGYTNEPKRCPECRRAKRARHAGDGFSGGYGRDTREMHPVVCAECGIETTVPFRPTGVRPVYCSVCFRQHRTPVATTGYRDYA